MAPKNPLEETFIEGEQSYASLDRAIGDIVLDQKRQPGLKWWVPFAIGFTLLQVMMLALTVLVFTGTGIWGINNPVGWGFAIINFVWWIGIGHAGTLISAILLLFRQQWRNSINRFAEAMTIFAVMCAGIFPLMHTGRPWVAYWLMPIGPDTLRMWPQFRSPLVWDVFAVSTYFTVSALFWFIGMIPDFATLRDRATKVFPKVAFGIVSMGWRGASRHWHRYEQAYLILAGLSTPLVLSVHSIVSLDFAVSLIPGWHATIFPPYFVAGAVYAGFAMVLTFAIPVRKWYALEHVITMKHIEWMAKIMLATGLFVFYGYLTEVFFAFYSGVEWERFMMMNRMTGPYWWAYWTLIFCNGLVPQILWSKKIRQNTAILFVVCMFVSIGMWLERFVIVVTSLHRDFLPSSWGMYFGTVWDWGLYLGTIGFFTFLMFLFMRFLPMINIFEVKELFSRMIGAKPASSPAVAKAEVGAHE
ncbi:MAG: polysulfide reductase NrfD [Fimbriimonadaceae bacterium]|nr:polysulfide reductase NrfD [Fimbriimonadaceae bacterium]